MDNTPKSKHSRLMTFLKSEDGKPDNCPPLDDDGLLHCKTIYYNDPKGKVTSIHFTLRVPEPLPAKPEPSVEQE